MRQSATSPARRRWTRIISPPWRSERTGLRQPVCWTMKAASKGRTAMQRIAVLALTLALTAVAAVPQGNAENYPSHPIRLIIGFPPGSAADITARLVGDLMGATLGQQLIVEARPGAGSSIAAEFVARSPADGYTLYIGTLSNVTNAVTNSNLHFD